MGLTMSQSGRIARVALKVDRPPWVRDDWVRVHRPDGSTFYCPADRVEDIDGTRAWARAILHDGPGIVYAEWTDCEPQDQLDILPDWYAREVV